MITKADFNGEEYEILELVESDRYPVGHIQFKKYLSMGYVQKYNTLTGRRREEFLESYITGVESNAKERVYNALDGLHKVYDELTIFNKTINIDLEIEKFQNDKLNKKMMEKLIKKIKGNI